MNQLVKSHIAKWKNWSLSSGLSDLGAPNLNNAATYMVRVLSKNTSPTATGEKTGDAAFPAGYTTQQQKTDRPESRRSKMAK